jgi:hypothetical protein
MKYILLFSVFFLVFLGCKKEKKIDSIEIGASADSVEMFEHIQLTAKVFFNDNSIDTSAAVTWHSNDTTIVKINANGIITTGVKVGSTNITATYRGISNKKVVRVYQNSVFYVNWVFTKIQNVITNVSINFPDSTNKKIFIYFSIGHTLSNDTIARPMVGFSDFCNSGGGDCIINGSNISIPVVGDTRMDCLFITDWELYLENSFRNAYEYSINGNQLIIKSKGPYNLFFEKYP